MKRWNKKIKRINYKRKLRRTGVTSFDFMNDSGTYGKIRIMGVNKRLVEFIVIRRSVMGDMRPGNARADQNKRGFQKSSPMCIVRRNN